MTSHDRLRTLLEAYGADPRRWPTAERAGAEGLLAVSAEARTLAREAQGLDALLDRAPLSRDTAINPRALAASIVHTVELSQLPRTGRPWTEAFGSRFAFGWANVAALAAAGVIGFWVGWTDINQSSGASRDMLDMMAPVTVLEEPLW
jgi:hypothetical protein